MKSLVASAIARRYSGILQALAATFEVTSHAQLAGARSSRGRFEGGNSRAHERHLAHFAS